jgi:hypothetical protein
MFPDASRFDPSRHLTIDGQLKDNIVNHFAFGYGRWVTQICYHIKMFTSMCRRVCPGRFECSEMMGNVHLTSTGRWFADNAVWTAMATILSVLRIDYARDVHGHKIDVKPEFTSAATV